MTKPVTATAGQGGAPVASLPRRKYMSLKFWLAANSYQRYREEMICECGHHKIIHNKQGCEGWTTALDGFCSCQRGTW